MPKLCLIRTEPGDIRERALSGRGRIFADIEFKVSSSHVLYRLVRDFVNAIKLPVVKDRSMDHTNIFWFKLVFFKRGNGATILQ